MFSNFQGLVPLINGTHKMNVKKSMNIICIILGISFIQMPNFDLNQLIPDVSKGGPLEVYRKKASFDWKQVKIFFEEPEHINYKVWLR